MDFVIYVLALIILFATVYPFYYVFILSFNEGVDASMGGIYWLPRKFTLSNYSKFFTDWKWVRALGITAARTILGTVLGVFFTTLVAYGISFKELIGRKWYMTFIIICMYFSGGVIPYYMVLKSLHLIDTFWVYIIPGMLNLFYITIGRTFFEGIPESLRESAKIDGAGEFRIFLQIVFPISTPILATVGLLIGVGFWNDWYNGLLYITDTELFSLQNYLNRILLDIQFMTQSMSGNVDAASALAKMPTVTVRMAIAVIGIVPLIIIFPFFQKYFAKGITVGAVKG